MPTLTFNANAGGRGRNRNNNLVYFTSHDAQNGDGIFGDLAFMEHSLAGGSNIISRIHAPFDTSGLPDNATITPGTCFIRLIGTGDAKVNGDTETIHIVESTEASPTAIANSDYGNVLATSYGSMLLSAYNDAANANNDIVLSSAGEAKISLTGFTKFALRFANDLNRVAPLGDNNVRWTSSTMIISVTYTVPGISSRLPLVGVGV